MKNTFTLKKIQWNTMRFQKILFQTHSQIKWILLQIEVKENLTKKAHAKSVQNQFKINTKTFYTQQKSFLSLIYFFFKWIYGVNGIQTVKKLLNEINFGPIWIHCYHLRTLSFTMLLFYISLNYLKKKTAEFIQIKNFHMIQIHLI